MLHAARVEPPVENDIRLERVLHFLTTNKAKSIDSSYFNSLSSEDAGTSSSLDLLLSNAADELGLHHNRSVDAASAEELEHAVLREVDHGSLGGVLLRLLLSLLRKNTPQLVQVHRGAVVEVALQVEVSHTDLTEVTGVARRVTLQLVKPLQLIEQDAHMVLTTGLTTTRRMATMLTYTVTRSRLNTHRYDRDQH